MPKIPSPSKAIRARTIVAPFSCNLCAEMNVTCYKEPEWKATMLSTRCYVGKKNGMCFITLLSLLLKFLIFSNSDFHF